MSEIVTSTCLEAYIREQRGCRDVRFIGGWDDDFWVLDGARPVCDKGQKRIIFRSASNLDDSPSDEPFRAPFADFARAMVNSYALRLALDERPPISCVRLIVAIRHLYAALPTKKDPSDLNGMLFTAAQQSVLRKHGRGDYANALIGKLQHVADEMDRRHLARRPINWSRSFAWDREEKFSVEAMEKRVEEGLLTEDDLLAWARLSACPGSNAFDVLRQRVIDLMVCGALRIHEVLTLPLDALIKEEVPGTGEDGSFSTVRYALRYWPHKGAEDSPPHQGNPDCDGPRRGARHQGHTTPDASSACRCLGLF